jgi:hypothetical protein
MGLRGDECDRKLIEFAANAAVFGGRGDESKHTCAGKKFDQRAKVLGILHGQHTDVNGHLRSNSIYAIVWHAWFLAIAHAA